MIEKNTVLILGAGASMDYGFPSGGELLGMIEDVCANPQHSKPFPEICNRSRITFDDVKKLHDLIVNCPCGSIDALLELREDVLQVGKLAIAHVLTPFEKPHEILDPKRRGKSWYQYLFNIMRTDELNQFGNNRLTVVTYNYDRSFEFFMRNSLVNLYRAGEDDVKNVFARIPVIHVHGQLGSLEENPYKGYALGNVPGDVVMRACAGIKVIHELTDAGKEEEFKMARERMKEADRVILLGFGYHKMNVDRLRLKDLPWQKAVIGSAFGMTGAETTEIERTTGGMIFVNKTCLDFIRETGSFYNKTQTLSDARKRREKLSTSANLLDREDILAAVSTNS